MTKKAITWSEEILSGGSINLTDAQSNPGATFKNQSLADIVSFSVTATGAGTLTVTPKANGVTTHAPYSVTNDTILLDLTGMDDLILTETGGSNVTFTISAFSVS